MLTVGTYGTYSATTSEGYLTVFDKNGQGRIQTADGNLLAAPSNEISAVGLGIPTPVDMNGIVLTENAIPITMGNTAYILNKVKHASFLWSDTKVLTSPYNLTSTFVFIYFSFLGRQWFDGYLFHHAKHIEYTEPSLRLWKISSILKHLGRFGAQFWDPYILLQWRRGFV